MDLGISNEELRELVIQRTAQMLLVSAFDEDTDQALEDRLSTRIDAELTVSIGRAAISIADKMAAEEIGPRVQAMIEGLTFQKHSQWGEPKEEPKTWRELLVERAERWLVEPVDYEGKTQSESRGSHFSKSTTRIAWMVDRHIQHHIDSAMRAALLDANKKLSQGILDAVQQGLTSAAAGIKLDVKIPPR